MIDLKGKVAIVTGCGRPLGIGRACALKLAEAGAKVVVSDLCGKYEGGIQLHGLGTAEQLDKLVEEIKQHGGEALAVRCDVTIKAEVAELIAQTVKAFDRIDIIVNNAGCAVGVGPIEMVSEAAWDKTMAVSVNGSWLVTQAALPHLKKQGGGKVINMSSMAGISSGERQGAYAAAKHAVIGITQTLGKELAPHNIQVNALCPGLIDTDLGHEQYQFLAMVEGVDVAAMREILLKKIPAGRFGTAEDVANACLFYASSLSDYVSGQACVVSGGYTR